MGACLSICQSDSSNNHENTSLLADNEREAVSALLGYLDNRDEEDFFSDGPLSALTTLVYSDNLDLQRSAALAFAEITEKYIRPVTREGLEPILVLLQSSDTDVQRASGAALGNLAVNNDNKKLIVDMGGLPPLIRQMSSSNVEVQCNAVGCMTNLATHDANKARIARSGALAPLTRLAKSRDMRVQRNATGALLNMTHSDENRRELVAAGAIPVLVSLLSSSDADVQYYCTTALSNIAVDLEHRRKLAATEPRLVHYLVQLMGGSNGTEFGSNTNLSGINNNSSKTSNSRLSTSPRVQCQAALALRNLASDVNYQLEIVKAGGLTPLLALLQSNHTPLVLAAVACLRNISIHPLNEAAIVDAGFLGPLVDLVGRTNNDEILCHAFSTLRNLAASSEKNKLEILDAGAVEKCMSLILKASPAVQAEMTACLAVLALGDEVKSKMLAMGVADVLIPLSRSSESVEVQGNAAAALGNLSSKVGDYDAFVNSWEKPSGGIHMFLASFITSNEPTFEHIAIWMMLQLLESEDKRLKDLIVRSDDILKGVDNLASRNPPTPKANDTGDSGFDDHIYASQMAIPALAKRVLTLLK